MNHPKWYNEGRQEVEAAFLDDDSLYATSLSPSGNHLLVVTRHQTFTRGRVVSCSDLSRNKVVADIKRNYDTFWHAWVRKKGGHEYLLCGEDVQGYSVIDLAATITHTVQGHSVIDLAATITHTYIDPNALEGLGFRWLEVLPSPDGERLLVEGCYFACPKVTAVYDFSEPTFLPLPKLTVLDNKFPNWYDVKGWRDNDTLEVKHDREIKFFDVLKAQVIPALL